MSKKLNIFSEILGEAYDLLIKRPSLLFPLCIVSFLETLWLELLYFTPRSPLKAVLLPPIQRFSGLGETTAHYPAFLFAIPRFFGYGQLLIYLFLGGILTAVTVVMTAAARDKHPLTFSAAWKNVLGPAVTLILLSLFILFLLGFIMGREFTFFKIGFDFANKGILYQALHLLLKSARVLNFFLALAIQTFVVFIFPSAVLENKGFFRAIGNSFVLGWRHFRKVYLLLLVPTLCYSPIWFLKGKISPLVQKTLYPEAIVWVLGVGILVTLLVDTFIAVSATLFFLRVRHEKGI